MASECACGHSARQAASGLSRAKSNLQTWITARSLETRDLFAAPVEFVPTQPVLFAVNRPLPEGQS